MLEEAQPQASAAQEQDDSVITPAFDDEMSIREMKASFSSNKGALTHLNGQVKVRAETFVPIKSLALATQLNEAYKKFLAKCNFLHRATHQLALGDKTNTQRWATAQAQLQPLQDQITRINRDAQVQVGVAAQPPETGSVTPGTSRVRLKWISTLGPGSERKPNRVQALEKKI